jgi:hypothetical protein
MVARFRAVNVDRSGPYVITVAVIVDAGVLGIQFARDFVFRNAKLFKVTRGYLSTFPGGRCRRSWS